ncbi:MAG: SDR family oxidoreductase [Acidimicrobiia bacterium]|nr:SDR family oxidoreductase [Acidimicrobiia bacterium]
MDLLNTVVLITGGRRMGQALTEALAARGADVALTWRGGRAEAESAVAAAQAAGRRGLAIEADLTAPDACRHAVNAAAEGLGRLDVLIHMASMYRAVAFDELTERDWAGQLAVDLSSTFHCAYAAVPHLRRAGGGRIITFGDWVAASGRPRYLGYVPYYVAKKGVIALTEALALELAGDRILVNAIAPGPIAPPSGTSADEVRKVEQATPLGRWGGEGAIVQAVLALIETDFITGETLRVDGGRHLK